MHKHIYTHSKLMQENWGKYLYILNKEKDEWKNGIKWVKRNEKKIMLKRNMRAINKICEIKNENRPKDQATGK